MQTSVLGNYFKLKTTLGIISWKFLGLKLRYILQKFKGSLLRFSSVKILNLELNFEFSPRGSGSNFGSEPNFGNTIRENMQQKHQSTEDAQFRTALENMRFKACTLEDIAFLRSLVSSNIPSRRSIRDEDFRNVSIITGTNLHKDEMNRLGAIRFAQETSQSLVDFYSDDSPCGTQTDTEKVRGVKCVGEVSDKMRDALWSQPPSSSDKHISGKLSICIGRECQGLTLGFGGFLWFFQGFLNNKPNFRSNVIFYRD